MKKSIFLFLALALVACSHPDKPVQRAKHVVLIGID